ncbi:MOSC and FAD-binding oxidoreductase domain-containing protein [Planotetraspora silvatica]|uniref:MOSC and FAD-binding oxidoreductase domain-containing protein n=1 Tax=Planotetraspora silvatica TaxID=234614 RepID=UPI0019520876|nr:MOSC and FAD-binding oxidoreductase domain-containing protein [Planotetraspora silvatica]
MNVGMPKDVPWQGRTVHTGVWKHPVTGPRTVRRLNVDGDGQGDLQGHGGEQRAVLVYQIQSYAHWQEHLGRTDFEFGQFGENFTVDGLPDDEVCIGDRYRIGGAEFEVTQPRVTCYRVGLRLGEPEMPALLVSHRRPGFYLRVITEGEVRAGDDIIRTRTGPGALSVAEIDALLYLPGRDPDTVRRALAIPALSPGWRQSFLEMAEDHATASAAEDQATVSAAGERGWPGFRPLRVTRITEETPSVLSIRLEAEDGGSLPAAEAGQYLTLRVSGAGDPPPVRSYSLSSAPGSPAYRLSVKRDPHGVVSRYLHAGLRTGAVLEAAAPRGDFVLTPGTAPVLLISGGIGVTPVLSMLHRLAAERTRRPVWWIHTTRSRSQHAFAGEAHTLLASLHEAHEHVFYTSPEEEPAPRAGVTRGRPTEDSLRDLGVPAEATAYLCGPEGFMSALHDALLDIGLAADHIHTELFGARGAVTPGIAGRPRTPPHQPPGRPGTGALVTFARSGLSVRWSPRFRSLLDLADACDVPTRWSCRTGVCHTCTTPIVSGNVDYSPAPLEPPAQGEVLVCCSRPETDLVLDL